MPCVFIVRWFCFADGLCLRLFDGLRSNAIPISNGSNGCWPVWFCGGVSGKSSRANFQGDGERFSLSLEERAGVRTVVSTNFVFWGRNGKTDLCFTLALTCVLSPPSSLRFDAIAPKPKATADGERILASMVQVVRLTVRQIRADAVWRRWPNEAGGGSIQ